MKNTNGLSGGDPNTAEVRLVTKSGRVARAVAVFALAISLVAAPSVGFANETASETSKQGGLGVAAALSSLFYGPVKVVYALGGVAVGSVAWMFTAGDSEVAEKVFTRSVRGTYVITPAMLAGEEPVEFIGRDLAETSAPTASVAAAAPQTTTYDESGYDDSGW